MAIHMGTIIRARRKELGMTQEELALKIGYKTKVAINKIEKGERKLPSDKITATAEALGISPNYLTSWTERGTPAEPVVRDTKDSRSRRMIRNVLANLSLTTTPDHIRHILYRKAYTRSHTRPRLSHI